MKNSFGNQLIVTLFGESHGQEIGVVLDGLTPGLNINEEFIRKQLDRRSPKRAFETARHEKDSFRIVSGVYQGKTTGTPLCIVITNDEYRAEDYRTERVIPRPGHADYVAEVKYRGFQDPRGGGHFSGRLTAPLVAAGAILIEALGKKGIRIGTHIQRLAAIEDRPYNGQLSELDQLESGEFPTLSPDVAGKMAEETERVALLGDSLGAVLETEVLGLPAGLGEPWFDSMEGVLSHGLFSIPGVKGVEFGDGFAFAAGLGSEKNDAFTIRENGIGTKTNHSGGINGGISNGMPLLFRTVIKPISSIACPQKTLNFETKEEVTLSISGRHDACIAPRTCVIQDSLTAMVLSDFLMTKFGTDFFAQER